MMSPPPLLLPPTSSIPHLEPRPTKAVDGQARRLDPHPTLQGDVAREVNGVGVRLGHIAHGARVDDVGVDVGLREARLRRVHCQLRRRELVCVCVCVCVWVGGTRYGERKYRGREVG